ncbi:MAG: biopolymer transporter ExbD [Phycisphaerales bacterium]|nr:biopolymer transporter ExbD [Phycisphaerales bacterium]MCI0631320.1 biopolymer transporter ExbD [Phycisphaerales bacterium]MCI0677054.1 biopolymer transporter ExbD [Phycisphaerales bacterium]
MNLTSLIDVTFLLIIFFVLVSKLNEVENVRLDLPSPQEPMTVLPDSKQQVVINVLPDNAGGASAYRVGVIDFPSNLAGQNAMKSHLAELYQANPGIEVNVRADRSTHYEHVEPVMRAVSLAARIAAGAGAPPASGMARINLVVLKER